MITLYYRIGPLHKGFDFVVRAEKEGYVMQKVEGELAVFRARQLSRIDVTVGTWNLEYFPLVQYNDSSLSMSMLSPVIIW